MRRSTKLMGLLVMGGTLLQFGGCLNVIWVSALDALLTNILTQFLPLGVNVVNQ